MTGYTLQLSDAELTRYRMMAERAREQEASLWEIAGFAPGATVADIGCGPGAMLPLLSEIVGPEGTVRAVDGDPSAVAAASAMIDTAALANADLRQGQADATGLEPGSFDAIMMRHVLAHNSPTVQQSIVNHLATLARPGGWVYLLDIDSHGFRFRNFDQAFEHMSERYREFHAQRGNDTQVGLRLPELLENAGFEVVEYRGWFDIITAPPGMRLPHWAAREAMLADGIVTEDDIADWASAYERFDASAADAVGSKRPTIFAPLFAAVGRRPL